MDGLQRALRIRPGESGIVLRLLAVMFLAWTGFAVGATGVESLLFTRFGTHLLPELFVAVGLVTGVTMLASAAFLGGARQRRFLLLAPLGVAAVVLASRILLAVGARWVYPAAWLVMMALWTVQGMALWGLAGAAHDTRQAKRLFPLYAAGVIAGGAVGGLAAAPLAAALGAENLLLVWAAGLVGSFAAGRSLPLGRTARRRGRHGSVASMVADSTRWVVASPLLRPMAGAMVLFGLLYFTLTLPFARSASARFPDPERLAAFLGLFSGSVNLVALLVSLFVANRLFARFGVAAAVAVLPVIYLAGYSALAVRESFVVLVVLRFVQMTWVAGIWTPGWQALFNVVPAGRRNQILLFMEAVPRQVGTIAAGALLIAADRALEASTLYMVATVLAGIAVLAAWRCRSGYAAAVVDALREGRPEVFVADEEPFGGFAHEAVAEDAVLSGVTDADQRVRRLAVEILGDMDSERARVPLARAAREDSDAGVRAAALGALVRRGDPVPPETLVAAASDADVAVRARAVEAVGAALARYPGLEATLVPLLGDPDPAVRAGAAARLLRTDSARQAERSLAEMVGDERPAWRAAAIEALALGGREQADLVARSMSDPDPGVRRAAVSALGALDGGPGGLTLLVDALGDRDAGVRRAAGEALAGRGRSATGPLVEALADPQLEEGALLALRGVSHPPPGLREYARLQASRARHYHGLWRRIGPPRSESAAMLAGWVRDIAHGHARRALRALAPFGAAEALDLAVENLGSRDPQQAANAVEALEAVGERETVSYLLPLWDEHPEHRSDLEEVLRSLLNDGDPWLRAGAAIAARSATRSVFERRLRALAAEDPDPLVRQAAAWTLRGGDEVPTMPTLELIERVMFLRKVPLFAGLPPTDLKHVAEAASESVHPDGEVIAEAGEPGEEMHVVVVGEIRVMDGSTEIARRRTGEYVGEMAILSDEPRMASLVASGTVRTLSIDRRRFERIVLERPEVSLAVMRELCARLRQSHGRDT